MLSSVDDIEMLAACTAGFARRMGNATLLSEREKTDLIYRCANFVRRLRLGTKAGSISMTVDDARLALVALEDTQKLLRDGDSDLAPTQLKLTRDKIAALMVKMQEQLNSVH